MSHKNTVRNLRIRYVIGLSAIALLVTASFLMMQQVIFHQRSHATLVNIAGQQTGLVNRIAFFAGLMGTTDDETEYQVARSQIGRSINTMHQNHKILRNGDPEHDIPFVSNKYLDTIYKDPMVGLEVALFNFLEKAESLYNHNQDAPISSNASYIYLTTYGPHVLEPLLDAAVDEYEGISNAAIVKIERFERIIWIATLFTLLCELTFIFIPLEGNVKTTLKTLERNISELTKMRKRLLMAQKLALVGDWEYDGKSGTFSLSDQVYDIFGITPQNTPISWEDFLQFVHPEDHQQLRAIVKKVPISRTPDKSEYRIVRPDGSERLVYQYATLKQEEGESTHISGTIQDITESKELSNRLEKLSEHVPGFIFQCHRSTDGEFSVSYSSKGIKQTCGIGPDQIENDANNFFNLVHLEDIDTLRYSLEKSATTLQTWHAKFRLRHFEKGTLWLEGHATPGKMTDGTIHWYGYIWDITERKEAEDKIHKLALYDPLTGLANRRLMRDRLKQALSSSQRTKTWGATIMLDLDNFKTLNDTQGHEMGDALLVEVAKRLKSIIRDCDTVSRLGGDEFVVLLSNLGNKLGLAEKYALEVAEKICDSLCTPYRLCNGAVTHYASASVGVAVFYGKTLDESTLLKRADVAMYEAKERGRNQVCFYSELRQQEINQKSAIISDLQRAISKNEFTLFFQPQIDRTDTICGAEVLIRWFPKHREPISPATFIPIAESSSLIVPIGQWVLQQTCEILAILLQKGVSQHFTLSVNISALQLAEPSFLETTSKLIKKSGVPTKHLKFEITESCLVKDFKFVNRVLSELLELGIRIELDDFGTGYSSLTSLYHLPISGLKIDRSLISNINSKNPSKALIRATAAMAKAMSMEVIAEGVETIEESNFLRKEGIDIQQGFHFYKPLPFEDFTALCTPLPPAVTAASSREKYHQHPTIQAPQMTPA